MKKLLLFSSIGLSLATNAQITITTADIATPTKIILQGNDTIPAISIGSPGTGMTWNMASLSNDKTDTITFLPYSAAPNPKFSAANLLAKFGWRNIYAYLINNSSGLTSLGNGGISDFGGGPGEFTQINTPSDIIANFPATYNSSYTNDHIQYTKFFFGFDPGAGFVIDSMRTKSVIHKTVVYDAWGSVTTPLGTYNALRAKEIIVKHDTTDAYVTAFGGWQNGIATKADSAASYVWWANGVGFPLVTARMDSLGNVKTVEWLQALPMTVGINEFTAAVSVNVYPNPAQYELNIAANSISVKTVQIYNIAGKQVDAFEVSEDISVLNTSSYANGIYTYKLIGRDNSVVNRGKFSVAK